MVDVLNLFSPKRQALKLKGFEFHKFFAWLSQSVAMTSKSAPGEAIALDINQLKELGMLHAAEGGWDKL